MERLFLNLRPLFSGTYCSGGGGGSTRAEGRKAPKGNALLFLVNFCGGTFCSLYPLFPATYSVSVLLVPDSFFSRWAKVSPCCNLDTFPGGGRGGVSGTCSVIRLWAFSPHEVASVLPRALSAAARRLIPRDSLFLALWQLGGLGFMDTRGVQWAAFCCRDGRKPGDVTLLDFDESRIFRYSL